jgi:hypothetical protein
MQMTREMSNWQLLTRYLRPYTLRLLLLTALLAVSIGLQLYGPQVIRDFLDAAQRGTAVRLLVTLGGLFFVITVVQKVIELWTTYLSEDLGWAATNGLRADLAAHTMRLDMGFHKLQTPGEIIERIDGDVSNLAEFFSRLVVRVLGNAVLRHGHPGAAVPRGVAHWAGGTGLRPADAGAAPAHSRPHGERLARGEPGVCQRCMATSKNASAARKTFAPTAAKRTCSKSLYPLLAAVAKSHVKADVIGGYSFSSSYMLYVLAVVVTLALAGTLLFAGADDHRHAVFADGLRPADGIARSSTSGGKSAICKKRVASIGRINEFLRLQPEVKETVSASSARYRQRPLPSTTSPSPTKIGYR